MARRTRPGVVRVGAILLVGVLFTGCTYSREEPGLFGRGPEPTDIEIEEPDDRWPPIRDRYLRTNPNLPVVGDETWTSGEGLSLTVRIAVHAVRRIKGATVLDWSVTPLRAPGLGLGDPVPATADLGLYRFDEGNTDVFLVDTRTARLYRPLVHRSISHRCLCTSIWRAQRSLRIGRTSLLQITYPELPAATTTVDVDVSTVPTFSAVPVTPIGMVPLAVGPTDLNRAPEPISRQGNGFAFDYPTAPGQRFGVAVEQVIASRTGTSLRWLILSLSSGPGLEEADQPPLADPGSPVNHNPIAASGPQLRVGEQILRARLVSSTLTSDRAVECLCSDLRIWARSLRSAGQRVSVVTKLPALPRAVRMVSVVFPGLGARKVVVTPATVASTRSAGPRRYPVGNWGDEGGWPRGWNSHNWPTAVPASDQLDDYIAVRDQFVR